MKVGLLQHLYKTAHAHTHASIYTQNKPREQTVLNFNYIKWIHVKVEKEENTGSHHCHHVQHNNRSLHMLSLCWAGHRSPILQTDLINTTLLSAFLESKHCMCAFTVIIRAEMEMINEMFQRYLIKYLMKCDFSEDEWGFSSGSLSAS